MAQIIQGLSDMMLMLQWVLYPNTGEGHLDILQPILSDYFPRDTGAYQRIRRVFETILGDDEKKLGSPKIRKITINKKDIDGKCKNGYVAYVPKEFPRMTVFCQKAFDFVDLRQLTCRFVGDKLSGKMDSLATTLLHELLCVIYIYNPSILHLLSASTGTSVFSRKKSI